MDPLFASAFIIAGLALQLLSSLSPFRRQTGPREIRFDLLGVFVFILLASGYDRVVSHPLSQWWIALPLADQWYTFVGDWPPLLTLLVSLVFADSIVYWTHRALHSSLLWHTHAYHHSPRHLWWLSGLRGTPVHTILTALPDTLAVLLFPPASAPWLIALIVFQALNQHWIHSNVRLPFERVLEKVFITPRVHFVHHSADMRYTNTNYAFLFTFWDRMFGTYTDPDTVSPDEPIGLDYENSTIRLILGLPPRRASQHPEGIPALASTHPVP